MIKTLEDLARREPGRGDVQIPFFIMTSGGTRQATMAFLEENDYFGLSRSQVQVAEQHQVPSIVDRDGHLARTDPYSLLLKPNGHGDVHSLLHQQGAAKEMRELGKTHLVFIQDTNAQIADLILPAVGVSVDRDDDFNFVCVPRVPGEPLGAVISLVGERGSRTLAVEYNQLNEFLSQYGDGGDRACANGYSAYPGGINLLVVKLDPYLEVLERNKGAVAEFINPKYADADRTRFAKPTRVETLMQDVVASYPEGARIGATVFDRDWALAALKNDLETAMAKARADEPTYSAVEAESGFYQSGRVRAEAAGARCDPAELIRYQGIPFRRGAHVVLSRSFQPSLAAAEPRLKNVRLDCDSTLVIDGEQVFVEELRLEGAASLVLKVCDGARLTVKGVSLQADGFRFRELTRVELDSSDVSSIDKMRGYTKETANPVVIQISEPGEYTLGSDLICRRVGKGTAMPA